MKEILLTQSRALFRSVFDKKNIQVVESVIKMSKKEDISFASQQFYALKHKHLGLPVSIVRL